MKPHCVSRWTIYIYFFFLFVVYFFRIDCVNGSQYAILFFLPCNNMFVSFMSRCSFNIAPKLQSNIKHGCCWLAVCFVPIFAPDVNEMLIISHFTLFNHRKSSVCAYTWSFARDLILHIVPYCVKGKGSYSWHWKVRVSFFAIYIHSNEIHSVAALIVYWCSGVSINKQSVLLHCLSHWNVYKL